MPDRIIVIHNGGAISSDCVRLNRRSVQHGNLESGIEQRFVEFRLEAENRASAFDGEVGGIGVRIEQAQTDFPTLDAAERRAARGLPVDIAADGDQHVDSLQVVENVL